MSIRKESRIIKVEDEISICDICGGNISVSQMWHDLSPKNHDTHATCVSTILSIIYNEPQIMKAIMGKYQKYRLGDVEN